MAAINQEACLGSHSEVMVLDLSLSQSQPTLSLGCCFVQRVEDALRDRVEALLHLQECSSASSKQADVEGD